MSIMIPAWVNGELTPVEKLEAHLRALRHKAVSVFILKGRELLIQKRAEGKYHSSGLWANTCCTHPEWGESGADCAVRRLDEELGIKGVQLRQRDTIEYRANVGAGMVEHEVVEIFVGHVDEVMWELNPDEVQDVRWISLSDLRSSLIQQPEHYTRWLEIYMDQHADMIFGDLAEA